MNKDIPGPTVFNGFSDIPVPLIEIGYFLHRSDIVVPCDLCKHLLHKCQLSIGFGPRYTVKWVKILLLSITIYYLYSYYTIGFSRWQQMTAMLTLSPQGAIMRRIPAHSHGNDMKMTSDGPRPGNPLKIDSRATTRFCALSCSIPLESCM